MKKGLIVFILICMVFAIYAGSNEDLLKAAREGNIDNLKTALENGANVDTKDVSGNTPLIYATIFNQKETVQFLISIGANVNSIANNNFTALIYAAMCNYSDLIELLILNGANVNAKDKFGYSALMCTASSGNIEMVKLLISKGADVNSKTVKEMDKILAQKSALDLARKYSHKQIVYTLINAGATN